MPNNLTLVHSLLLFSTAFIAGSLSELASVKPMSHANTVRLRKLQQAIATLQLMIQQIKAGGEIAPPGSIFIYQI